MPYKAHHADAMKFANGLLGLVHVGINHMNLAQAYLDAIRLLNEAQRKLCESTNAELLELGTRIEAEIHPDIVAARARLVADNSKCIHAAGGAKCVSWCGNKQCLR